ncbi:MauE/DoxX family redox-associated membrane protein [Microtetraspora niveoalba]|uniref:MauE/DoxX family redox-associated membrane protein n=1 Tax=Microtetraspora niveoalba TaxID=46175 RepID=UPI00083410E2|nr:MauE/DoxX family redox-associated membrane protein [Microtetraspora niveoalba]
MSYLTLASRLLLMAVFVLSSVGKLRDLGSFARSLVSLKLAPARLAGHMAASVVAAEAAVVSLLALAPRLGLASAAALLLAFTVVIVRAMSRGQRASCNCFGKQGANLGGRQVVRNVLLMGAALLGAVGEAFSSGSLKFEGIVIVAVAVAALTTIVYFWDDLVDLLVPIR